MENDRLESSHDPGEVCFVCIFIEFDLLHCASCQPGKNSEGNTGNELPGPWPGHTSVARVTCDVTD